MTTTTPAGTTPGLSITTTDHPNAQRMRRGFEAFGRGDLEAVRADATDDATWTNAGTGPLAGTYRGWAEVAPMFGRLFELTGGTFSMALVSVLADERCAFALYDATATVSGSTETHRFAFVQELAADGRSTATRLFAFDQEAADRHLSRT